LRSCSLSLHPWPANRLGKVRQPKPEQATQVRQSNQEHTTVAKGSVTPTDGYNRMPRHQTNNAGQTRGSRYSTNRASLDKRFRVRKPPASKTPQSRASPWGGRAHIRRELNRSGGRPEGPIMLLRQKTPTNATTKQPEGAVPHICSQARSRVRLESVQKVDGGENGAPCALK